LGSYLTNPLTRSELISFTDISLQKPDIFRPKNVSLQEWHDVIAFYAREGWLLKRWGLEIPNSDNPKWCARYTPDHNAEGESVDIGRDNICGPFLKNGVWNPYFLSDEEKQELIGKPYRIYSNKTVNATYNYGEYTTTAVHIVSETDFVPRMVKNRDICFRTQKKTN
jgi:hypothetical protein